MTVVFQGVLDIIDEERRGVSDMHHDDKKRQGVLCIPLHKALQIDAG